MTETERSLGAIYDEANRRITELGLDSPEVSDILTTALEEMTAIMRRAGMTEFVVFHPETGSCVISVDGTVRGLN
jgi:hypothetical protein